MSARKRQRQAHTQPDEDDYVAEQGEEEEEDAEIEEEDEGVEENGVDEVVEEEEEEEKRPLPRGLDEHVELDEFDQVRQDRARAREGQESKSRKRKSSDFEERKRSANHAVADGEGEGGDGGDDAEFVRNNERERSHFAECGILKRVELTDFMCHQNFDIELGPNVNFIGGQNGTGKSAILSAIQAGLGAKASDTHRGSNLGSLVRTGASEAKIVLTIKNEGPNAFEPQNFGKAIRVERVIKAKGSSSFRLMDHTGRKTISRNRKKLAEMLDHFSIQPTNPCVIMDQQTCKDFLTKQGEKDKYQFFLKATQLESMKEEVADAQGQLELMKTLLHNSAAKEESKKKKMVAARREYEKSQRVQSARSDLARQAGLLAWVAVQEFSKEYDDMNDKLKKAEGSRAKMDKLLGKHNEGVGKWNEKQAQLLELIAKANEESKEFADRIKKKRTEAKASEVKYQAAKREVDFKKAEVKERKRHRDAKRRELDQARIEANRNFAEEEQQRQERINQLKNREEQCKGEIAAFQAQMEKEEQDHGEWREKHEAVTHRLHRAERDVRNAEETLRRLQSMIKDPMSAYGRHTSQVNEMIKEWVRAGKFSRPPIGPIGAHISIRPEHMGSRAAIETCLKAGFLQSYLVERKDMPVMNDMFRHMRLSGRDRPSVVAQPYREQLYDFPRIDLRRYPVVFDCVTFDNAWIACAAIDQTKCERALIADSHPEAMRLVREVSERFGNAKFFLKDSGDRIEYKHGENYIRNPYRPRFLNVDTRSELEAVQRELDDKERERAVLRREHQDSQRCEPRRSGARLQKVIHSHEREIRRIADQIRDEEMSRPPPPQDIAAFEEEVSVIDDQIADLEAQVREDEARLGDLADEVKRLKAEADALHEESKRPLEAIAKYDHEINRLAQEHAKSTMQLEKTKENIAKLETFISETGEKLRLKEAELQEAIDMAKRMLPESPSERLPSKEAIQREMTRLKAIVEAGQKELKKSANELHAEMVAAEAEYLDATRDIKTAKNNAAVLDISVEKRAKEWEQYRRTIARRANIIFQDNLRHRKLSGDLKFDMERESLSLVLGTSSSGSSGVRTTDTKSLSGGERSFTSLSFMLALGEAIESPFRAMDEFDVCMDSMARHTSMEILLNECKTRKNRQFLFFTPLDLSPVMQHEGPQVKVMRLKAIDRNQARINLEPAQS